VTLRQRDLKESFGSSGGPAFFYPPAGVTVAAMPFTRRASWPAVVAAIMAAEIPVDTSQFLTNARSQSNQASMPSPVRALTGRTTAVGLTSRTRAT